MKRLVLMALAVLCIAGGAYLYRIASKPVPLFLSPTVKITVGDGHGSGVHIGNGYILTANHVAGETKGDIKVKAVDGSVVPASLLWANKAYDIALIKIDAKHAKTMKAAHLKCGLAKVGDNIMADGTPLAVEFVSAYGKIAGLPREVGAIKSVYITDITTVMGQSGGPVFDKNGDVVGITVAVMTASLSFGSRSLTGFGFAVPSSVACMLMART